MWTKIGELINQLKSDQSIYSLVNTHIEDLKLEAVLRSYFKDSCMMESLFEDLKRELEFIKNPNEKAMYAFNFLLQISCCTRRKAVGLHNDFKYFFEACMDESMKICPNALLYDCAGGKIGNAQLLDRAMHAIRETSDPNIQDARSEQHRLLIAIIYSYIDNMYYSVDAKDVTALVHSYFAALFDCRNLGKNSDLLDVLLKLAEDTQQRFKSCTNNKTKQELRTLDIEIRWCKDFLLPKYTRKPFVEVVMLAIPKTCTDLALIERLVQVLNRQI